MSKSKPKPANRKDQPTLLEKISEVAAVVKTDIAAGASAVGHTVAGKLVKVKKAIQKKIATKTKPKKKAAKKAPKKTSSSTKKKAAKAPRKTTGRKPVPKKKSSKR